MGQIMARLSGGSNFLVWYTCGPELNKRMWGRIYSTDVGIGWIAGRRVAGRRVAGRRIDGRMNSALHCLAK